MAVKPEIQAAGWQSARELPTAKSVQHRIFEFARDPDLAVIVAFVIVGLLLSVLFPLSEQTAIQLAQIL